MEKRKEKGLVGLGGPSIHPATSLGGAQKGRPPSCPTVPLHGATRLQTPFISGHDGGQGRLPKEADLWSGVTVKTQGRVFQTETDPGEKEDLITSLALDGEDTC